MTSLADRLIAAKANSPKVPPHVVLRAYAGTGKTFTQVCGVGSTFGARHWDFIQEEVARRKGKDPATFRITPSEEQAVVWRAIQESVDAGATNVAYGAFNKSIVNEFSTEWGWMARLLKERCGVTLTFKTINGMGYGAVSQVVPGRIEFLSGATDFLLEEVVKRDVRDYRRQETLMYDAVTGLVSHSKTSLLGWDGKRFDADTITNEELMTLAVHHDMDIEEEEKTCDVVREVLKLAAVATARMDFDDQNWLPVIHNWYIPQADLLLVDEAQDLNRVKQEYALRAGKRLIVVGDPNQAIYGFAGADTESMNRLQKTLGVKVPLTLTETRRCGKAIVKEAQRYVKDFKAHPGNHEGEVKSLPLGLYREGLLDGDMILCRVNVVLVAEAMKLLRMKRKVVIRGRQFGTSLINFIKRLKASSVRDLETKMEAWATEERRKEEAKKSPSSTRLENTSDRVLCIGAFAEGTSSVQEVIDKINVVFAGKQCPKCQKSYAETVETCYNCKCELKTPEGILLSSIHRAKGLEADNVYYLQTKLAEAASYQAKKPWQRKQEDNLRYVAITRAIHKLTYVYEPQE